MHRLFSFILAFSLILHLTPSSYAAPQDCREQVVRAFENVMGVPGREALHGYLKQLSDLMSTNLESHVLIAEVEQLARDARLEVTGICREVSRFDSMNEYYVAAYDLTSCKALSSENVEGANLNNIVTFCEEESEKILDTLLDALSQYLLRQAVRTSMEPVLLRMRSLNARLTTLISEYSRLVNNFFTFSFRLGDTITGERD